MILTEKQAMRAARPFVRPLSDGEIKMFADHFAIMQSRFIARCIAFGEYSAIRQAFKIGLRSEKRDRALREWEAKNGAYRVDRFGVTMWETPQ